jgi:ABC-type proline/glycine betaine transport system ATPase subunit
VPSVPLGREREARHLLIVGSVGGGKTQTMLQLINEALVRGDGLLVLGTANADHSHLHGLSFCWRQNRCDM